MSPRGLRSTSILGGVVIAAIVLASWSQPWFIVTLTGQSAGHPDLQVGGDVSAPAVAALAIAAAAGFAAMAISGVFFRAVLAVLEVILGASVVLSAILAISTPVAAVEPAVTKATSVAGSDSVQALIGANVSTVWPFVALVAGILLALFSATILFTSHRWPISGRRYEAVGLEPVGQSRENRGDSSISDWDELSGGADPTSG